MSVCSLWSTSAISLLHPLYSTMLSKQLNKSESLLIMLDLAEFVCSFSFAVSGTCTDRSLTGTCRSCRPSVQSPNITRARCGQQVVLIPGKKRKYLTVGKTVLFTNVFVSVFSGMVKCRKEERKNVLKYVFLVFLLIKSNVIKYDLV